MHARTRSKTRLLPAVLLIAGFTTAGCSMAPPAVSDAQVQELAARYVRSALRYPHNPIVRAQAVEAAESLPADQRAILRDSLADEHAGVRFAACMAIGRTRDTAAFGLLEKALADTDPSVRVAAYFAMERLGRPGYRSQWAQCLRRHPDPVVRRNAALTLGQLEDKSVIPLLQEASKLDDDEGVRIQALEGLAALGDSAAVSRFVHDAFGSIGYKQPFALLALGRVPGDAVVPTLRSRLAAGPYLEARLAAARSLGMHGYDTGADLALQSLNWTEPPPPSKDAKEPPEGQIMPLVDDSPENSRMRIRSMAALALGDIGDVHALPWLKQRMETPDDPRVQLAAARAILMIVQARAASAPPGSATLKR